MAGHDHYEVEICTVEDELIATLAGAAMQFEIQSLVRYPPRGRHLGRYSHAMDLTVYIETNSTSNAGVEDEHS